MLVFKPRKFYLNMFTYSNNRKKVEERIRLILTILRKKETFIYLDNCPLL